ncbi:hypothetical protein D3C72_2033890 [compost metagenome]
MLTVAVQLHKKTHITACVHQDTARTFGFVRDVCKFDLHVIAQQLNRTGVNDVTREGRSHTHVKRIATASGIFYSFGNQFGLCLDYGNARLIYVHVRVPCVGWCGCILARGLV